MRANDSRTIGEVLRAARARLRRAPHRPETREARLLLGHVLGFGEAALLARSSEPLAAAERARFEALLERRLAGEPAAYLLGEREFYGRAFRVDPRVLIPRPETEHLIAAALELDLPPAPRILDVGTGSGAIAVTLAAEIPRARLLATDLSPAALALARRNAARHAVDDRVWFLAADLLAAIDPARFDLVVSNPPYVDERDPSTSPEVRGFEPPAALFAPQGGRGVLARLLAAARALRPGVALLLEIGYDQSGWLADAASRTRGLELVEIRADYAGIPRTAVLRRAR